VELVLFYGLLIVGFYLLAIRPQRQRAKAQAEIRASVQEGSAVVTTAGIHGTVVSVADDLLRIEVAPGVVMRFARGAVLQVVPPATADVVDDDGDGAPETPRSTA
jgi:preprotein translocase subunit YajC